MANRQMKLVVVGQENVGKTALIEALKLYFTHGAKKFKKYLKSDRGESTEGIEIESFHYSPKEGGDIIFKFWDFSGLEMYYSTHSFFLSDRSIYVVAWKLTSDADISRVPYWLQTIRFHAPKSPIILVATHFDSVKRKRAEKIQQVKENLMEKYKSQFPNLVDVVGVSSTTGQRIKGLGRMLENIVRAQPFFAENIPEFYFTFNKALSRVQAHKVDNLQKGAPVLEWEAVERVGDKCQVPREKLVDTVKYFETTGDIVYFPGAEVTASTRKQAAGGWQLSEKKPGFIIVEPQWLTQLFSTIVTQNSHIKNGILSRKVLENVIWTPPLVPKEIHDQLFRVLISFEVVFHLRGSDTILIPSLLGSKPENFQAKWPSHDPSSFQFARYYDFTFFPASLFPKFLVQLFQLKYNYDAWSTGILISHTNALCFVERTGDRVSVYARAPELDKTIALLFSSVYEILEALLKRDQLEHVVTVPCPQCLESQISNPTLFSKEECDKAASARIAQLNCKRVTNKIHIVPLYTVVPDLATIDFECKSIDLSSLELNEIIQETNFFTKYKSIWNNEPVLVKVIKFPKGTLGGMVLELSNSFRQEVQMMCRFDHPCIVQVKAHSLNNPPAIITEFFENGDLATYLKKHKLDWPLRIRIAYDIACGLLFLHHLNPSLIHRGLRPSAIMLSSVDHMSKICAKLSDFGSARDLDLKSLKEERLNKQKTKNELNQSMWMSPELIKDEDLTTAVDVYPYGLVLWQMVTQESIWSGYKVVSELEFDILSGKRPDIPSDCPESYASLIKSCWVDDPQERPSFTTVLNELIKINKQLAPSQERTLISLQQYTKAAKVRESTLSVEGGSSLITSKSRKLNRMNSRRNPMELGATKAYSVTEKVELGFVARASNTLVDRWMGKARQGTFEPTLVEVAERLHICPYPGSLENLKNFQLELETIPLEYKVYNLSPQTYDYSIFSGIVVEYQLESKEAPQFKLLLSCVEDIVSWLNKGEETAALIHGYGKSRISVVVTVAVLLRMKKCKNIDEALGLVKSKIANFPSLEPSQKRYLQYYAESLIAVPKQTTVYLHKLRFTSIPNFKFTGGCDPIYSIQQEGRTVFFSKKMKGRKDNNTVEFFCRDINVSGDIKVEFFHKSCSHKMFSLTLNTHFETFPKEKLVFERTDLDFAWKESSKKHFHPGFKLEVFLLTQQQQREMNKKMKKAPIVEESTVERRKKMAKNKRPSSRLMKSFFPKPKDDAENDVTESGEQSVSFAEEQEICFICKKPILVNKGQDSIGILPGVTVHYSCLECADCGASLRDSSLEAVVKSERIICNNCEKEIFPKCQVCTKVIKGNDMATHGDNHWHPECLPCTQCKTPIKGIKFKISDPGNLPYCSICSEKNNVQEDAPHKKTSQEEELEQLLGEAIGRQYFSMHLKDEKACFLLDFWVEVEERREEAKEGRAKLAIKIEADYLTPGNEKSLPEPLLSSFHPRGEDKETMDHFDKSQRLVFYELAKKYIPTWTSSPHFLAYITALVSENEEETKEDDLRRAGAKQFIPIQQEDLMCQATVILDLDENMQLIEVNLDTGEKEEVKGEQPDDLIAVVFAEAAAAATKAREIADLVDKRRQQAQQKSKDKSLAALDLMMDNVIAEAFAGAEIEIQRRRAPPGQKKTAQDLDKQLNAAILQAFGGKQSQVNRESRADRNAPQESSPTPSHSDPIQEEKVSAAKRKMAELWVNGSLQQAKFSFEVAENARKVVEASFQIVQKAFQLANQEHRPLDVVEKALVRINKEIEIIEMETKKAQNTVLVVQNAANEARANGADLPQTSEVMSYVEKVADEVRAAIQIATKCPSIVERANQIYNDRKTIANFLTGDLDSLLG